MVEEPTEKHAAAADTPQVGPPWLTVESGLYILLVLVAGVLRFWALGSQPLQEREAGMALDVWRFYTGGAASIRGHSPLLFHGTTLFYALFGAGDYVARLVPALAGTLMVGLPYLLRPRLGRRGALLAAAFLAVSPSFLFFSRQLNGDTVAAAACLALVAGIFAYVDQSRPWQLYAAAASLAVALLASGATYTTLLVLGGLAVATLVRTRVASETESPRPAWFGHRPGSDISRKALGVFAATVLLLSTGLLVNLQGIQATLDLISVWIAQFQPVAFGQPWHYYLSLLVAYELPLLVFGLVGAVYLSRRDVFFAFLTSWFAVSLVLYSMMGTRPASGILQILLPLVLMAGRCAGDLLRQLDRGERWLWGRLTLVVSVPVVFHLVMQMAAFGNPLNPGDPRHLALALLSVFFLICVALVVGVLSMDWRTSLHSGGLVVLVALTSFAVHSSWRLNYHQPGNPREIIVEKPTSPDVRHLAQAIEEFSNQQERQRHSVSITATGEEDPILAWYLRSFGQLRFVSGVLSDPTPVVITPLAESRYLKDYRGARFRLRSSWQVGDLPAHDLVNWFLFRESLQPLAHRDVVMWVAPEPEE
jgi:uncharacterized protein (TIGR03663 family)